jgi:hypothetical protein
MNLEISKNKIAERNCPFIYSKAGGESRLGGK